ncbi:MAG: hypothetical protein AMXMBFR56_53020 [Polyangiaceae bacterium]
MSASIMIISPIAPVFTQPPAVASTGTSATGLPPPVLEALNPSDPEGELMAMLERMNQMSTQLTERELRDAGAKLKEQLDKFMKQMADAMRRAQAAARKRRKKKGFFKRVAGSVSSFVGGTIGKALAKVTMSPSLEKKLEGFTRGALSFGADLAAFNAKLAIALAANGPDLENAWKDVKAEARTVAESFQENCLENPDFMEVVGLMAKAGAVAAAIGSGGALAPIAVLALAACEADARTNAVEEIFGKDAAPWVRLGMNVASSALLGAAGGDSAARYLTGGAAILQGASSINAGIKLLDEAEGQASEIRHQANLTDTLNRMHELQRLIEELLGDMEEHAEDHDRSRSLSGSVVEIKAATYEAVVLRG